MYILSYQNAFDRHTYYASIVNLLLEKEGHASINNNIGSIDVASEPAGEENDGVGYFFWSTCSCKRNSIKKRLVKWIIISLHNLVLAQLNRTIWQRNVGVLNGSRDNSVNSNAQSTKLAGIIFSQCGLGSLKG